MVYTIKRIFIDPYLQYVVSCLPLQAMRSSFSIITALFLAACNYDRQEASGDWIKGSEKERIRTIESQFRGFDQAMVETGYRYQELYWAGQDTNWDYAKYQLEKIELTIKNGLQRRPKRAPSATHFLTNVLPGMQRAISGADTAIFNKSFKVLTAGCNSCHAMEKVPFFTVNIPTERQSPIRK